MTKPSPFLTSTATKTGVRTMGQKIKRLERKTLVAWMRYSQKHRHSFWLPFVLFAILFLDGFLIFIPSLLLLVAATTISPQRWWGYGLIFGVAVAANNAVTYFLGRHLPLDSILHMVNVLNMEFMWESAQNALHKYGSMATLVGALIGLPTQMIMALIGVADAGIIRESAWAQSTFLPAISLSFVGHTTKALALAGFTRFGWVKLEKKFQADVQKS